MVVKMGNEFDYSLNEIEGFKENLSGLDSGLIEKYMVARSKKLKDLSVDEIRVLLSQLIGLAYIVPLALNIVEQDPLISSGLYSGDLAVSLFNIDEEFWSNNPEWNNRLIEVKFEIEEIYKTISEEILPLTVGMDFK